MSTALVEVGSAEVAGVQSLVQLAVEKGVAVDVLERLVSLQERVTEQAAQSALFEAISAFQDACPRINKARTAKVATKGGSNYSYTYASLDDIEKVIRPVLRRHKLSYTWDSTTDNANLTVTCTLRHVLGSSVSASFTCPTTSLSAMSDQQKVGAALTYGRRQSLVSVAGLTQTDDDTDAADPVADLTPISDEQLANLQLVWDEVKNNVGPKVLNQAAFFRFYGCATLLDLPAARYTEALAALASKR